MNKKANTLLFILGGTVVNLILAIAWIGVLLFLFSRLSGVMGEQTAWLFPVAFLGGIMIATIMYQKIAKWVIARFRLEDKLDPLFSHTMRKVK